MEIYIYIYAPLAYGIAYDIITITGSHFEGGYSSGFGGGMLITTNYSASEVSQHGQNNLVYINNTEFVENHANSGGAVAVVSCTGTELHINGSKFHNNVAYYGGHIAIGLVSRFPTCKNTTITISETLFKEGNATRGSGGGVAVQGTYSNVQMEFTFPLARLNLWGIMRRCSGIVGLCRHCAAY